MDLLNFPHSATWKTKSDKELYDGAPSTSPITLTGTIPSSSFRCLVILSSATGHTDTVGHIYINSEDLNFSGGVLRKTSTILLTSTPAITYSGLDCNIQIICVDANGQPITTDTSTAIKIRFEPTSKAFQDNKGLWTQSSAYAMVVNSSISIGDMITYNSTDYFVKQIEAFPWIDGNEVYRILYF